MRFLFWVTALAVLSLTWAKNSTTKAKPKRQLETLRTPQSLQYSLVLPHSRVTHYRSLTSDRRVSNVTPRGKLPPYAVQMEPVVQYSQKDPLYDPNLDSVDDSVVNQNQIYAQPKILNIQDQASEGSYGPPYGALPTAPLYSQDAHPHPQYYDAPEPIIEIIIQESNETLPAPPPPPVQKKKKEPVHVFYVKYSKDPHNKDKVVYEKPIPAITPPSNEEDDHHQHDYVTVTPEPYIAPQTTTLRAIIKPESEQYHSDSSVKITFGNDAHSHSHHYDRREGSSPHEDHEETAPRPAIAIPQQYPTHPTLERSASARPHYESKQPELRRQEPIPRPVPHHPTPNTYRHIPQNAQSRIQFQPTYLVNEQQLPRQGPSLSTFRAQPQVSRQNPFAQPQPSFPGGFPSPSTQFANVAPTVPGPIGPIFPSAFPRPGNAPAFHPRPSNQPPFAIRPHFNGPQKPAFNNGPQRPFHQPPQPFFDEPKYLQENYHTITTEQVEPPKEQLLPNRPQQNFHQGPRPGPSPTPQFQEQLPQSQIIPSNQQLPHQRPLHNFVQPSGSPFFNLKPSPPHIEENRIPFQQNLPQRPQPQQQQFSFHQGIQSLDRPSAQIPQQHNIQFSPSPSPSPIPHHQFLPQPTSPTVFNLQAHPSQTPEQQLYEQNKYYQTERPQIHNQGPSERPIIQSNFRDQSNIQHQQNVGQFVPKDGELVAAIPKYEQHITVSGPTAQPEYSFSETAQSPAPNGRPAQQSAQQYAQQQHQIAQQQAQQHAQQQAQQHAQQQAQQHAQQQAQQHAQQQAQQHAQQQEQHHQQQQAQKYSQQSVSQHQPILDPEQEQVRLQLAQNVQKQQEEIRRLQSQLLHAQQQHHQQVQQNFEQQHLQQQQLTKQFEQNYQQQSRNNYNQEQVQATTPKAQYSQKTKSQAVFSSSSPQPPYHSHYQSTARTVEIKPTTPKYVSSTINSIQPTPEAKKEDKKKRPTIELPDEVPDDLRQQLLSSGILDNADISVLDYDKVGDTPLESLPPDQLANFFSAGGGQQIAASEPRPIVVAPNGARLESRIDEEDSEDDQDIAASENVATYAAPPPTKQAVEMKVVHFDPKTEEGQIIAKNYVKEDATQTDPVALNDKKYNRYLPLKVSGNQFPLPDILKGLKVTSVVVLAPVQTEALKGEHARAERAAGENLKGIKFIAGDSLQALLKKPSTENFKKWLDTEKKTATDLQSVVLLVTGDDKPSPDREIFMYDISSGNVNKLNGDLSNAFVEAAENNALSKDIEKLAIEGEGTHERFDAELPEDDNAEASENVPFLIDLSGVSLEEENNNQVSISSGYSKTKHGRSLRRH